MLLHSSPLFGTTIVVANSCDKNIGGRKAVTMGGNSEGWATGRSRGRGVGT